ncbi:hypothetical protein WAK64_08150 [Bacillus spongiae]|uniref:Spore coat protein n=1 Tax=Bacillus spongiae TaxID=2683610 RepID=A0ABU8HCF7_9BACI
MYNQTPYARHQDQRLIVPFLFGFGRPGFGYGYGRPFYGYGYGYGRPGFGYGRPPFGYGYY